MNISPQHYGLHSRTVLQEVDNNHIAIVKLIKSRIIKKDALKILAMIEQIHEVDTSLNVSLMCHDNICSKSVKLLEENKVGIIFVS